MQDVLEKIITQKKKDLENIKKKNSLAAITKKIKFTNNYLDFKKSLVNREQQNYVSLIAEIKKASPSAGVIVKDFDHVEIANLYSNNGVTCLSVLTEERFFLGSLRHIEEIKKKLIFLFLLKIFLLIPIKYLIRRVLGAIVF